MKRQPLYIEIKIKCKLDDLWAKTQEPSLHEQWELRFTEIKYLPKDDSNDTQHFLYETKIGFGINIKGVGESVATKTKSNGESISVLKFSSDNQLSLIKVGSGYWKYQPTSEGIVFVTRYNYETRWGYLGFFIDLLVFRPLMVWATAWSFDRLRLWIEKDYSPKLTMNAQIAVWIASISLGLIWIHQGLVPKILFPETGEISIMKQSGLFNGYEVRALLIVGIGEIIFGFILLIQKSIIQYLNILALVFLVIASVFNDSRIFTFPFSPLILNIAMVALSIIILVNLKQIPQASNCITKEK